MNFTYCIPRSRTIVLFSVLVAAMALASCQLLTTGGVTIDQRVKDFSSGYVNGQYAQLYLNFSQKSTSQYNQIKPASYWDGTPFAAKDGPQALTNYTVDTKNATVSGTYTNANGSFTISMQMVQDVSDWYIQTLTLTPSAATNAGTFDIRRIF